MPSEELGRKSKYNRIIITIIELLSKEIRVFFFFINYA